MKKKTTQLKYFIFIDNFYLIYLLYKVDLEKFKDDEELDIEKRFNVKIIFNNKIIILIKQNNNQKDRGLADLEVGSECYMTDMLDFEFDDGEECDETTELDLIHLGDQSIKRKMRN